MVEGIHVLFARAVDGSFPEQLAGGAVEALREQLSVLEGGQENVAAGEDRGGLAGADGRSPEDIFVLAEFNGEAGAGGDAGSVGAAEAGPVLGGNGAGEKE